MGVAGKAPPRSGAGRTQAFVRRAPQRGNAASGVQTRPTQHEAPRGRLGASFGQARHRHGVEEAAAGALRRPFDGRSREGVTPSDTRIAEDPQHSPGLRLELAVDHRGPTDRPRREPMRRAAAHRCDGHLPTRAAMPGRWLDPGGPVSGPGDDGVSSGLLRAISSAGQSARFTSVRSLVRTQYRPPSPAPRRGYARLR